MKYTVSIDVALPRQKMVRLLADPTQYPMWLEGLVSHEAVDGTHGEVGTTSRVVFDTGGQIMEGTERITRREPAELSRITADAVIRYERELVADGMWSAVRDRFTETGPETTHWESESEYRFDKPVMRLVAPLMKRMFRKQSLQNMIDFKAFAEHGTDVRKRSSSPKPES